MTSGRRARPIMTPASSAAPRSVRRSRPRAEQAPLESSSDWWKTSRTSSARITLPLELGLKSSCWLRAAWREPLAGWADDRCALSRGHPPTIRVAGEDVDVPARRRPRLTLVVPAHLCATDDNRRRVVQTYLAVIDVTLDLIERQGGRRHHGNEVGLVRHRTKAAADLADRYRRRAPRKKQGAAMRSAPIASTTSPTRGPCPEKGELR